MIDGLWFINSVKTFTWSVYQKISQFVGTKVFFQYLIFYELVEFFMGKKEKEGEKCLCGSYVN